jgi:hypothetical protein
MTNIKRASWPLWLAKEIRPDQELKASEILHNDAEMKWNKGGYNSASQSLCFLYHLLINAKKYQKDELTKKTSEKFDQEPDYDYVN